LFNQDYQYDHSAPTRPGPACGIGAQGEGHQPGALIAPGLLTDKFFRGESTNPRAAAERKQASGGARRETHDSSADDCIATHLLEVVSV